MLLSLLFICSMMPGVVQTSIAQEQSGRNGIYLSAYYGIHWPAGDLADRFGHNFAAGAGLELLKNQKWVYGIEGQFLFGKEVNENVAGGIVDDRGILINASYNLADIDVKERGVHIFGKVGRIHDFWGEDNISGIKWTFGVGYLQHKIRLKDSQNAVPFFEDDYIKGFDRLTAGISLTQFVGYQYLDHRGRLNLFCGAELTEAFTKSQRGLSYSTKTIDDDARLDLLVGFKAGIQITIKSFRPQEDIWY